MSDQHASACDQVASAPAHMSFETQKIFGGHISLKTCPNWVFEVFLASTGNVYAKNHLKHPI